MIKYRRSLKQGGKLPDHDPNNPYHYHDSNGNKIVITPEEWEANVGKPYFKEIEDAVRAEQAAHPGPEYEVNPDFVRDLRSTYRSNMGNGYQNYRNFSSYLPQGYTFSSEGMIVDQQGNYYVQSGYIQTPRFTYSTDNPLNVNLSSINKNLKFYPINMDKRIKAPLPVDKVMNVSDAREKAIQNYINNNSKTKVQKMYNTPYVQTGVPHSKERFVAVPNITNFSYDKSKYHVNIPFESNTSPEQGWDIIPSIDEYDWHFINQDARPDVNLVQQAEQYSAEHPITEEEFDSMFNLYNSYINKAGSTGMNRIYPKEFWRNTNADKRIIIKPSRKEAEKKAIIKINPLEKVGNKRRRLESAGQLSD